MAVHPTQVSLFSVYVKLIVLELELPYPESLRISVHYHSVLVIDGSLQCVERRAVR